MCYLRNKYCICNFDFHLKKIFPIHKIDVHKNLHYARIIIIYEDHRQLARSSSEKKECIKINLS